VSQLLALKVGETTATPLTNFTAVHSIRAARVSTDGNSVYFIGNVNNGSNPSGLRQLYSVNVASREIEMLSNFSAVTTFNSASSYFLGSDGGSALIQDSGTLDLHLVDLRPDEFSANFETGFGSSATIQANVTAVLDAVHGLGAHILTSRNGALSALEELRGNIKRVSNAVGNLGAVQSRLSYAHALVEGQQSESLAAASRIADVDVAETAATLIRQRILQQSAAALLGQANQQPALSLQLLSRL